MAFCYVTLETRSHAFLLERRLKGCGIPCELAYIPRDIMTDVCNMGVRFDDSEYWRTVGAIRQAGLPGYHIFREIVGRWGCQYVEEQG